jgi:hypothetical protein
MPVKYQISEKSLEKREQILLLCKTSKSLNELSALTGDTVSSLRFNVKKLTESKHLKLKGTKLSDNNQPSKAYIATGLKYQPLIEIHIPVIVKSKDETKNPPWLTVVTCNDNHPTRMKEDKPKRRDAWIGSTFSTMSF